MKKIVRIVLLLLVLIAGWLGWEYLGPATAFKDKNYYLYIHTGSQYANVLSTLQQDGVLSSPHFFDMLAKHFSYPGKIKPGRYNIRKGMNLVNILRMLRNGRQEPVNLVITKLRTKEDLAALVGRKLECDSAAFLAYISNVGVLKPYGLDSNTVMTSVLPDTYTFFWNTTPSRVFAKFRSSYEHFWTPGRMQQAREHGLNSQTAYILASIVEEETLKQGDKGKIASVYLNRMAKGMRLSADPTVKFALHDFGLKRIYEKHLAVESPYNTYRVTGLPPGPICTPSEETINAVIAAPQTRYLYFVANASLDGYSHFAESYEEHLQYAHEYQQALDRLMQQKQAAGNHPAQ